MRAPIGFGLIGCGLWGSVHARTYAASPHVSFRAVCDLDPVRAGDFSHRYGAATAYGAVSDLLADPSVQAVGIATPDFTHTALVRAALEAGKHVLVEKPLATTPAECQAMLGARDAAGVRLMVDFHNRWNLPLMHVRRMVESGELGELVMMNIRLNDTLFVPTRMLGWADRSSPAHFLGSHVVDLVRWVSGAEIERVYSVSRSHVLRPMGIDTPDFYQSILELSNGGTAVVENCWVLGEKAPSVFDFKAEFVGTRGTSYVNTSDFRMIEAYTHDQALSPDVLGIVELEGRPTGFCIAAIEHFIDCLLHDAEPRVTGEDGLAAARVVEAMEQSAATGMPVSV